MPTPKDAPYKQKQHAPHYATFYDASAGSRVDGGLGRVRTRGGRRYVIDPVTGQWWRPEKYLQRRRR